MPDSREVFRRSVPAFPTTRMIGPIFVNSIKRLEEGIDFSIPLLARARLPACGKLFYELLGVARTIHGLGDWVSKSYRFGTTAQGWKT